MSAPIRFLACVVAGWGAIRAVTLGAVPGFTVSYARQLPATWPAPIVTTRFPQLPPVDAIPLWPVEPAQSASPPVLQAKPVEYPGYYALAEASAPAPIAPRAAWRLPEWSDSQAPDFYSPFPTLESLAGFPPARVSRPAVPPKPGIAPRLDRWQFSSWALLRGPSSPGALATGGTLGGSQGGARLTYAFNRWIAASLRTTSPLGGSRGAEIAGGVRLTPFRSIPVAFTVERRQAISPHGGGRSDFAFFAEGGLYRQPMPLRFTLDAYVQAGIVGISARDPFIDGAFAFTRPVAGRFSAGLGFWGGYQPGLYRIDAGPRISIRLRDNIYAHVDWRQRLAGSASPASGPALTLAADF
jgi:hypothetical protein